MLRVDLERKTVEASVRDLIEEPLEVPRPAGVLSLARAALGTEVHRAYRAQRESDVSGFQAEVTLFIEHAVDGFEVRVRGRADGVIDEGDGGLLVEEVKSIAKPGNELAEVYGPDLRDARVQVRLYALALSRTSTGAKRPVRARLVLISLVDGTEHQIDVPFDENAAGRTLDSLLRRRIQAARGRIERAHAKAELAERLVFPYEETRPYQQEFAEHLTEGLTAGRPILAMAPTGIGKTVASLLPALRFAMKRDATLFFLTAKTTQQALVARTFEDLCSAAGVESHELRALTFREKRRMCPPGTLLCHPDHCPLLVRFLDREARERSLDRLLEDAVHLDPDTILERGEEDGTCPYALALALSMRVDLVICDYNYVYDPVVAFSLFADERHARPVVVIVDEAHNLFDRARDYYSPFLPLSPVAEVRERAERGDYLAPRDRGKARSPRARPRRKADEPGQLLLLGGPPAPRRAEAPRAATSVSGSDLFQGLAAYLERLDAHIRRRIREAADDAPMALEGCRPVVAEPPAWVALAEEAARLMVRYTHYVQVHGLMRLDDPVVELLHTVMSVRHLVAIEAPEFVPYVAAGREAPAGDGYGVLCVNPARQLLERHEQVAGTVAMSATLYPLAYYRDVLGFASLEPLELDLPSPFPPENRCVAVVPTVSTTWRERRQHYGRIAGIVDRVVGVRAGNYVAYFPSFAFLEGVREKLELPYAEVIVQERRMSPDKRRELLDRMLEAGRTKVLLAVMGGVFAEGIDLPGEALVGAIVVGPGLPQVGFERAAMQNYFDEQAQRGFAYAMLYPGMQRVIQSAGRVHRTPEDRGVIVLLGRRFLRDPYVRCLPSHWYRYDVRELATSDPASVVQAFWLGRPASGGVSCYPAGDDA